MKHRIVILGAGYAGASAAGRLTRRLHGDDVDRCRGDRLDGRLRHPPDRGLTGGRLPNYPLGYVHQCISLGRRDGIIQLVTSDDRARSVAVGGRLAALYKEFICWAAALGTAHPMLYPAPRRRLTTPRAERVSVPQL
jgi:NADPH-dependent 2,4-dienoyl-CoA reductase/sulfur reductase-like enzyme